MRMLSRYPCLCVLLLVVTSTSSPSSLSSLFTLTTTTTSPSSVVAGLEIQIENDRQRAPSKHALAPSHANAVATKATRDDATDDSQQRRRKQSQRRKKELERRQRRRRKRRRRMTSNIFGHPSGNVASNRIVGGTTSTSTDRFGYMGATYMNNGVSFNCGASLIAPDLMLTAAHCVGDPDDLTGLWPFVKLGFANNNHLSSEYEMYPFRTVQNVESAIHVHPQYRYLFNRFTPGGVPDHDLAVVALWGKSKIKPIKVNLSTSTDPDDFEPVLAVGWGYTDDNSQKHSEILRTVHVDYYPSRQCGTRDASWDGLVTDATLCTLGYPPDGRVGTCVGDSGAPLLKTVGTSPTSSSDIQIGISSWTEGNPNGCTIYRSPSIFSRTSAMADWLRSQVCSLSVDPPDEYNCPATTTTAASPTTGRRILQRVFLTLELTMDSNPNEIGWMLQGSPQDRRGKLYRHFQPGHYSGLGSGQTVTITMEVDAHGKEYSLILMDSYGDGLDTTGSYRVYKSLRPESDAPRTLILSSDNDNNNYEYVSIRKFTLDTDCSQTPEDPNQVFARRNGNSKTCKWLQRKSMDKIQRLCSKRRLKIPNLCPTTCGVCPPIEDLV